VSVPILATKLYIPPRRPNAVFRARLVERLNEGLRRQLTVISAAAGFGKTTLISEWVHRNSEGRAAQQAGTSGESGHASSFALQPYKVAWLSLDEGDSDPARFLTYLVAALQTIAPNMGEGLLPALSSPQPPPAESILTALLNQIAGLPNPFILVLDDYHLVEARPVDEALAFLLEHLPPQMHLVIATREDPHLPLARLRARGQLTELRAADLRLSPAEAAEFLNQVMGLDLSVEAVAALEARTEGWIVGLQLAALSMQGHRDTTRFIQSFTGSHRFVLDYLLEEVLQRQPERIQTFLLRTSILERLCGPLCDAVVGDPSASGQDTLEYLEHANLFMVPLDNERRWYRYHHLFANLLQQRLGARQPAAASSGAEGVRMDELHQRASAWYEANGLEFEAFQHAVAANDVERAARLIEGTVIPLHFRGTVTAILDWLQSLPVAVLEARPALWWRYASLLLVSGQTTGVEEKLQAAEAALRPEGAKPNAEPDDKNRNLIGQIAMARATLALTRYQVEPLLAQSRRALEYLHPNNLSSRATAHWTLGFAYQLQGERVAAREAFTSAITFSQATGDIFTTLLATIGLGNLQEADNELQAAAESYQRALQLAGDQPLQILCEAHLGLARVCYEWNDLEAAEQHGQASLHLAQQYESVIDRFVVSEVFLARLKLAQGDAGGAAARLAQADQSARQRNFVLRLPEVAAAQVEVLLHQGRPEAVAAAAQLAQAHALPMSQARVHLAQGQPAAALAALEPVRRQAEARGWADERLRVMVLQAVALQAQGEKDQAAQLLGEALALAQPGGFVRLFVDEGPPLAQLLSKAAARGIKPDYAGKLLAAFEARAQPGRPASQGKSPDRSIPPAAPALSEPLTERELEILRLIAQGLSNREIAERLFLAVNTVKGHNRVIFDKLQAQSRTEAVARARELGLLSP
jgi:LuxR family maltose regulon positive regulatory protein